jgi:hypothetical protein
VLRWLIGLVFVLVLAPTAQAQTFSAAADSPENPNQPPARDIARVVSTLDADGRWTVTVSLRGEPAEGTTGAVNAVLYPPSASCGTVPNDAVAFLRGNDSATTTDVSGSVVLGGVHAANGGSTKEHAPGSATVTLGLMDTALAGFTPGCLTVTLSNHGVLDEVDAVPFSAPDQPAPVLPPLPPPAPPAPPLPTNPTIAFAHPNAKLKASKAGVIAVALKPFDRDVKGKLTVTDSKGHTLGGKSYSAKSGAAVTVKVRLNAATRRVLAKGRSVKVKLTASVGTTLTKRANATVRRA